MWGKNLGPYPNCNPDYNDQLRIYCYKNEKSVLSFCIKTINKSCLNIYVELVINKPPKTSV